MLLLLDRTLDAYSAQENEPTVTLGKITTTRRVLDACCALVSKTMPPSSKSESKHFDAILKKVLLPALNLPYEEVRDIYG